MHEDEHQEQSGGPVPSFTGKMPDHLIGDFCRHGFIAHRWPYECNIAQRVVEEMGMSDRDVNQFLCYLEIAKHQWTEEFEAAEHRRRSTLIPRTLKSEVFRVLRLDEEPLEKKRKKVRKDPKAASASTATGSDNMRCQLCGRGPRLLQLAQRKAVKKWRLQKK